MEQANHYLLKYVTISFKVKNLKNLDIEVALPTFFVLDNPGALRLTLSGGLPLSRLIFYIKLPLKSIKHAKLLSEPFLAPCFFNES